MRAAKLSVDGDLTAGPSSAAVLAPRLELVASWDPWRHHQRLGGAQPSAHHPVSAPHSATNLIASSRQNLRACAVLRIPSTRPLLNRFFRICVYARTYVAPELGPGMDQFPTIAHTTTRGSAQALLYRRSTTFRMSECTNSALAIIRMQHF